MRGETIEQEFLRSRDFTINAMALDIRQADRLIDPLGGLNDLRRKILTSLFGRRFVQ